MAGRILRRLTLLTLTAGMLGAASSLFAASLFKPDINKELQVKTQQGKVQGVFNGKIRAYLGIPFAAPPVGQLRWKPPVPPAKWSGVRLTREFGSRCMQPKLYADMVFRDPGISEDCLTLNVWTPATPKAARSARLPVMVWIFGGGFITGGTSEARQDGANLAGNAVVVVSMNYRLGIFGYFAHPGLAAESGHNSAGNYGLMDQTAALQWVHDNIEVFGGDPGNVTLFGESAGSFSVSAQEASPLAKGLFQRVIGESGGAFGPNELSFQPLEERETQDATWAQSALHSTTIDQLRAVPAQQVLDATSGPGGPVHFRPDVDGYFLPERVADIFAAGKQNDVTMLAGYNRDEGGIDPKTTLDGYKAEVAKRFPGNADGILNVYPASDDATAVRAAADLAGDRYIAYATWEWIEEQAKTGKQPVYRYRFDLPPPADPNHQTGIIAYHSAEIPYVFGTLDLLTAFPWRPEDRELSRQMQKYWTNFARSGDPNGEGLPLWPVYKADSGWMVLHLSATPAAEPDRTRPRDLYLESIWAK